MSWKDTVRSNYTHVMRICRGDRYEREKACNVFLLHKIHILFTHLKLK